jgi:hypothetical protein
MDVETIGSLVNGDFGCLDLLFLAELEWVLEFDFFPCFGYLRVDWVFCC